MFRADVPGFYFDPDRNRYFPVTSRKGRTSEQTTDVVNDALKGNPQKNRQNEFRAGAKYLQKFDNAVEDRVLELIQKRELSGHGAQRHRGNALVFQRQHLEAQTFRPRIWKYESTDRWADGGLEQLRVRHETPEGDVEGDVVIWGGTNGRLSVLQISERNEVEEADARFFLPSHCLPSDSKKWIGEEKEPPILRASGNVVLFPSRITSIKRLNEWSGSDPQDGNPVDQSLLVTSLGCAGTGGSLVLLQPRHRDSLQQNYSNALSPFQSSPVVNTCSSVWTAEANPRGRTASLGLSLGAAIVDLERSSMSWLCHSSDVLSQQFDSMGKTVLCGFRNGVISTIDLRLPRPKAYSQLHAAAFNRRPFQSTKRTGNPHVKYNKRCQNHTSKGFQCVSDLYCSHTTVMQMKSAICSMVLLRSCEFYLLASAMNGSIKLWDRRMVSKGSVCAFEGHCNTHTMLQLRVDPTERLLVSGGEDGAVRIWSVASSQLLHTESGLPSAVITSCWPTSLRRSSSSQWGGFVEESPFEEDHVLGLWMGSQSGVLYMHGGTK